MDPNTNDTPNELDTPEPSVAEALDAGIEASGDLPAPEPEPEASASAGADAAAGDPPVPGTAEALAAEKAAAEAAKPEKPEPDKGVEDEISALKLGEKAGERFRGMAAEIKSMAPIREALEKAGVKDAEQLGQFLKRNEAMTAVMGMMEDTGATDVQFGQTFDYLALVTRAGQGDRKAAQDAFDMVTRERNELAKALGIEVDGFDPLAEYKDLLDEVDSGDLPRARALEIAAQRRADHLQTEVRTRQQQDASAREGQEQAIQAGRDGLNALERELMASDPAYAQKREALYAQVQAICREFPPAQWASAAKLAYRGIVVAPPAKPAPGPMRPGGPRPAVAPVSDDPMEALNFGIAASA